MDLARPRIVIVTRPTLLELLLERHGTLGQARFYLASRGREIAPLEEMHARFEAAMGAVQAALPTSLAFVAKSFAQPFKAAAKPPKEGGGSGAQGGKNGRR